MRKRILIADDEPNIIELIRMNLPESEFEVLPSYTGDETVQLARSEQPDLILLDIMLPDLDGLEVLRILRTDGDTASIPVLMLTARSEETDKVVGLRLGADDYITKPFGLRELEARVRSALRRSGNLPHAGRREPAGGRGHTVAVHDLVIDLRSHEVTRRDVVSDLTPSEFTILHLLASRQGAVVSRRELLAAVSGDRNGVPARDTEGNSDREPDARVVDVHIRNLRRKLNDPNEAPRYIETVRGVGYRMKKARE